MNKIPFLIFGILILIGCSKEIDPSLLDEIDGLYPDEPTSGNKLSEGFIEFDYFYKGTSITELFDKVNYEESNFKTHFLGHVNASNSQKKFWDEMYALHGNRNILFLASTMSVRKIQLYFKGDKLKTSYHGFGYVGEQYLDLKADTIGFYRQRSLVNEQLVDFSDDINYYALKEDIEAQTQGVEATFSNYYTRKETGKTVDIKGYQCKEIIYEAGTQLKQMVGTEGALIPTKIIVYTTDALPNSLKQNLSYGTKNDDVFLKAELFYNNQNSSSFTIEPTKIDTKAVNEDVFSIDLKRPIYSMNNSDVKTEIQWQIWQPLIMIDLF